MLIQKKHKLIISDSSQMLFNFIPLLLFFSFTFIFITFVGFFFSKRIRKIVTKLLFFFKSKYYTKKLYKIYMYFKTRKKQGKFTTSI